jgi:hypothetical protein
LTFDSYFNHRVQSAQLLGGPSSTTFGEVFWYASYGLLPAATTAGPSAVSLTLVGHLVARSFGAVLYGAYSMRTLVLRS